jgi:hypothetical protein
VGGGHGSGTWFGDCRMTPAGTSEKGAVRVVNTLMLC